MKPGVYSQLYIQIIFAVANRECLFRNPTRNEEIFKYISGIITGSKNKSIIVNGFEDHIHLLIGLNPKVSISDLVGDIKRSSSLFINGKNWFTGHFSWQEGYGAFSYRQADVDSVYKYIQNQTDHHKRQSFKREYEDLLKEFGIEYNEKYLFRFGE